MYWWVGYMSFGAGLKVIIIRDHLAHLNYRVLYEKCNFQVNIFSCWPPGGGKLTSTCLWICNHVSCNYYRANVFISVLPSFLVVVVLTAPGCFCFITFLQILPGWPVFRTITLFFTFTCNITSYQGKSNLIGLDFTSPGRHSSHFCRVETL